MILQLSPTFVEIPNDFAPETRRPVMALQKARADRQALAPLRDVAGRTNSTNPWSYGPHMEAVMWVKQCQFSYWVMIRSVG